MPWLLLGLLVAAWLEPILGHTLWANTSIGLQLVVATVVGALLPITPLGATPIATLMMHKGVSPSATLAFLLMSPLGAHAGAAARSRSWLLGVIVATAIALACGWGLTIEPLHLDIQMHDLHGHHDTSTLQRVSLYVLAGLLFVSMLRQGPRLALGSVFEGHRHDP